MAADESLADMQQRIIALMVQFQQFHTDLDNETRVCKNAIERITAIADLQVADFPKGDERVAAFFSAVGTEASYWMARYVDAVPRMIERRNQLEGMKDEINDLQARIVRMGGDPVPAPGEVGTVKGGPSA